MNRNVVLLFGVIFSLIYFCKWLWNLVRHPLTTIRLALQPPLKKPEVLNDRRWGRHEYLKITSNIPDGADVEIHYVSNGSESNPLMLCLHGFPECWYSFRHQLKQFSSSYRVVAVDLRGYGESSCPQGKHHYRKEVLLNDIDKIIQGLGASTCTLVGHDWGGILAWRYAYLHPEKINNLIILNCPNTRNMMSKMKGFPKDPIARQQFFNMFYMYMFQLPIWPEVWLRSSNYAQIRSMFLSDHHGVKRTGALTDQDVNCYVWSVAQPGSLTAALNYYRNVFEPDTPEMALALKKEQLMVRTLLVFGENDGAIRREMIEGTEEFVPNVTIRYIPNCSHWVQQDAPDEVNQEITRFLADSK